MGEEGTADDGELDTVATRVVLTVFQGYRVKEPALAGLETGLASRQTRMTQNCWEEAELETGLPAEEPRLMLSDEEQ